MAITIKLSFGNESGLRAWSKQCAHSTLTQSSQSYGSGFSYPRPEDRAKYIPKIPYTIMIVVAMDFNKKNSRCSIVAAADSVMNSIIFKVIV